MPEPLGLLRRITIRGGPGSGHFGHEGRPGQRGGSLPGEGGGQDETRYKVEGQPPPKLNIVTTGQVSYFGGRGTGEPEGRHVGPMPAHYQEEYRKGVERAVGRFAEHFGYYPDKVTITNDTREFLAGQMLSQMQQATQMAILEGSTLGAYGETNGKIWMQDFKQDAFLPDTVRWHQGILHELGHWATHQIFDAPYTHASDARFGLVLVPESARTYLNALAYEEGGHWSEYAADLIEGFVSFQSGFGPENAEGPVFSRDKDRPWDDIDVENFQHMTRLMAERQQARREAPEGKPLRQRAEQAEVLVIYELAGEAFIRPASKAPEAVPGKVTVLPLSGMVERYGTASSGHRGHKGRPGQRGGSLPGEGAGEEGKTKGKWDPTKHNRILVKGDAAYQTTLSILQSVHERTGWSPKGLNIVNDPKTATEVLYSKYSPEMRAILARRMSAQIRRTPMAVFTDRDDPNNVIIYIANRAKQLPQGEEGVIYQQFLAHELGHVMERWYGYSLVGVLPNSEIPKHYEDALRGVYPQSKMQDEYYADLFAVAIVGEFMPGMLEGGGGVFPPRSFMRLGRHMMVDYEQAARVPVTAVDRENMGRLMDRLSRATQAEPYPGKAPSANYANPAPPEPPAAFRSAESGEVLVYFDWGNGWGEALMVPVEEIPNLPDSAEVLEPLPADMVLRYGTSSSGHWGHKGRPGYRGGSQPGGSQEDAGPPGPAGALARTGGFLEPGNTLYAFRDQPKEEDWPHNFASPVPKAVARDLREELMDLRDEVVAKASNEQFPDFGTYQSRPVGVREDAIPDVNERMRLWILTSIIADLEEPHHMPDVLVSRDDKGRMQAIAVFSRMGQAESNNLYLDYLVGTGGGAGSKVMFDLLDIANAEDKGIELVSLDNARDFYKHLGFDQILSSSGVMRLPADKLKSFYTKGGAMVRRSQLPDDLRKELEALAPKDDLWVIPSAATIYRVGNARSGNWGHRGRPGQRGGSLPGGGYGAEGREPKPREKKAERLSASESADRLKSQMLDYTRARAITGSAVYESINSLRKGWIAPDGTILTVGEQPPGYRAEGVEFGWHHGNQIMAAAEKAKIPLLTVSEANARRMGQGSAKYWAAVRTANRLGFVRLFNSPSGLHLMFEGELTPDQRDSVESLLYARNQEGWHGQLVIDKVQPGEEYDVHGDEFNEPESGDINELPPRARALIGRTHIRVTPQEWVVLLGGGIINRTSGLLRRVLTLADGPFSVVRGGEGSGHYGHKGRPGERGGSLPGEGPTERVGEVRGRLPEPPGFVVNSSVWGRARAQVFGTTPETRYETTQQEAPVDPDEYFRAVIDSIYAEAGSPKTLWGTDEQVPAGPHLWIEADRIVNKMEYDKYRSVDLDAMGVTDQRGYYTLTDEQVADVVSYWNAAKAEREAWVDEALPNRPPGTPEEAKAWLVENGYLEQFRSDVTYPHGEGGNPLSQSLYDRAVAEARADLEAVGGPHFITQSEFEGRGNVPFGSISKEEHGAYWAVMAARYQVYRFELGREICAGNISPSEGAQLGESRVDFGEKFTTPPETLWHVTTNADAVVEGGIKSRTELAMTRGGVGLSGGPDETISFTDSYETAKNIERTLTEAQMVASGEISFDDLIDIAHRGVDSPKPFLSEWVSMTSGAGVGLPRHNTEAVLDAVRDWKEGEPMPDAIRESSWYRGHTEGSPERVANQRWTSYSVPFLHARQGAGGPPDPVLFGTDYQSLAKLDTGKFRILEYRPATENVKAWQVGSLGEWRFVGGENVELVGQSDYVTPENREAIIGKAAPVENVDVGGAFDLPAEAAIINQAATGRNALLGSVVERGGPTSGHWGHLGRPGYRGGSQPGEGGAWPRYLKDSEGLHYADYGFKGKAFKGGLKDAQQAHSWGLRACAEAKDWIRSPLELETTWVEAEHGGHAPPEGEGWVWTDPRDWDDPLEPEWHNPELAKQEELPDEADDFIDNHVENTYSWNNGMLRRPFETNPENLEQFRTSIAAMDVLMDKSKLPEAVVVWRGMGDWANRLRPGREFIDKGYTSTTLLSSVIGEKPYDDYGNGGRPYDWKFAVQVPRGTMGYYVGREHGNGGVTWKEYELMLDRGTKFRVLSIDRENKTGVLRVIGQQRGRVP